MKNVEEKLAVIMGNLLATQASIRVIIETHPNRDVIAKTIAQELEYGIADVLQTSVPDGMLAGIRQAQAAILPPEYGGQ